MKFSEIVKEAKDLLQSKGRITYRVLKREFALDEEQLEDLKEDLLFSHPEIEEADGRGLVWAGDGEPAPATPTSQSSSQSPSIGHTQSCVPPPAELSFVPFPALIPTDPEGEPGP